MCVCVCVCVCYVLLVQILSTLLKIRAHNITFVSTSIRICNGNSTSQPLHTMKSMSPIDKT